MRLVEHPVTIRRWILDARFTEPEAIADELVARISAVDKRIEPHLKVFEQWLTVVMGAAPSAEQTKTVARRRAFEAIALYYVDHPYQGHRYFYPRIVFYGRPWAKFAVSDVIHILDLDADKLLTGFLGSGLERDLRQALRDPGEFKAAPGDRPLHPLLVRRLIDASRYDPILAWQNPLITRLGATLAHGVTYGPTRAAWRTAKARLDELIEALAPPRSRHVVRSVPWLTQCREMYLAASKGVPRWTALKLAAKRLSATRRISARTLANNVQLADAHDRIQEAWAEVARFLEATPDHPLNVGGRAPQAPTASGTSAGSSAGAHAPA